MTQQTKYDLAVYIGRFQPPCKHHIQAIHHGLKIAERLLIFVGSANSPRTIKNPFTAEERIDMIRSVLSFEEEKRVCFVKKQDSLYDDNQWVAGVEYNVNQVLYEHKGPVDLVNVCLVGCPSDHTSWYLDKFPTWKKEFLPSTHKGPDEQTDAHATDVRNAFLCGSDWVFDEVVAHYCYAAVTSWLMKFRKNNPDYGRLVEEYDLVRKYKESWANAPYPPTFVTVDAVVVQSANVLLVRRGASPGKGLLALPGGFVEQKERIANAVVRELKEETRIDVPPAVLFNGIKKSEVFDHPDRSLRGRTITHAFLIELYEKNGVLPWIKGGDDAASAVWVPFSELANMRAQMFEDHWDIINHMVGGLNVDHSPIVFGRNNLNR